MTAAPETPVLFLVFNRPDLAARVFARIREARPSRLFIAADGPRPDHPDDGPACRETRLLAAQVDWPCEVKTLFRETNLGCRRAVESAITWFFEQVEAGIILEDDCLPDLSFFPFCAELLERYRDDEQVMSISGDCFQLRGSEWGASYSFSIYHHIWGWATWRRAWRHYNSALDSNPCLFDRAWLAALLESEPATRYWSHIIARYHEGHIDTWDLPWNFSCWIRRGLCVAPAANLVENIGFDLRATHTKQTQPGPTRFPLAPMRFPLRHPAAVRRDPASERASEAFFLPAGLKPGKGRTRLVRGATHLLRALHQRAAGLASFLETLVEACRARTSFVRARRLGLPGKMFYCFGRSLGWTLWRKGLGEARHLLMTPVNTVRYFEFDFAWRALAGDPVRSRRCLDVSSPFLFSLAVARHFPEAEIRIMNPSAPDLQRVRRLVEGLCWPGIECVQGGVEELDREPGTYDAIWSLSVVEHVAGERGDDRDAVRRMWKALRPGGRLILTVPTDQPAWDEYRDHDPYGTQPKSGTAGTYFFQRFYDEAAIRSRLVAAVGQEPSRMEWFGEKTPGHFHAYVARWRRDGLQATVDDPLDVARNYRSYASFADMPGFGVCGLLFVKSPAGSDSRADRLDPRPDINP